MSYEYDNAYTGITERLANQNVNLVNRIRQTIDAIEPQVLISLILVFAGSNLISFYGGWQARGLWGPIWDNRGWAALVVISIVVASLTVRQHNDDLA